MYMCIYIVAPDLAPAVQILLPLLPPLLPDLARFTSTPTFL